MMLGLFGGTANILGGKPGAIWQKFPMAISSATTLTVEEQTFIDGPW